jgi:hypothetical protein
MATRRWTAVLLLAAVFVMHGVQCGSAGDGAAHAGTAPVVSVAGVASASGDGQLTLAGAAGHGDPGPPRPTAIAPVAGGHAVPVVGTSPGGGHGMSGHLWTVCLAVLAAGLALLLALLTPRLARLSADELTCAVSRAAGSLPLPRPPDLHTLCLLRT